MSRRQDRFIISPFRHSVQTDPQYAEATWATLRSAISKINDRKTSELSFEELYRYSYNMVLHKHGDVLYSGLAAELTSHLRSIAVSVINSDAPTFLAQLQAQWSWFKISLSHIRDVLMYMDRTYVHTKKKKTVHELGIALFRDHVVQNESIAPRLIETILADIDRERSGEVVDTHLVRSVTRMLAELGDDKDSNSVYVNVFEKAFLERTRQFYAKEAQAYLTEATCSDYLRKAAQRIREEEVRVESYLDLQTGEKVRRVAEKELICNYMQTLIEMENSGLIWMLRNDRCSDLQLMYRLFRNVPDGQSQLRTHLKNEVLERGTSVISNPENESSEVAMVSSLLELKEKYDEILKVAFFVGSDPTEDPIASIAASIEDRGASAGDTNVSAGQHVTTAVGENYSTTLRTGTAGASSASATGSSSRDAYGPTPGGTSTACDVTSARVPDRAFVTAVNEAFERFLNLFQRAPEYISIYVDNMLRQDLKGMTDEEIEARLDAVMTLFRFLHEKDVFERYYKQHLSRRLLSNRTTSHEAERSFISKLKNECGYLFTSKMETMFTDMRTSSETTAAFRAEIEDTQSELCGIDVQVSVLTTISWPIPAVPPCNVPASISQCCSRFEDYYYRKHNGRMLKWQTHAASAELRASFGDGSRQVDLAVSGYGMCILMLFNENEKLTYNEIQSRTAIPPKELTRNLQTLAMGKHRVLLKDPRPKEICGTDVFTVNEGFTSKTRKVKIHMVSAQRENEKQKDETRKLIDEDRRPFIEAAVVRIMKARKVLEHQQLIAEVTAQLGARFQPSPQDIKRGIERLVDNDYLERNPGSRSTYTYMA